MSLQPAPWDLPGPSAFVAKAAEQAHGEGIIAFIIPKHCPSDLDAALRDQLGVFDLPTINARDAVPPLEALSRAFDTELRSARSLSATTQADGRAAFVIGIDTVSAARWETTLRAYLAGCGARSRFGSMLILGTSPDCQPLFRQMGIGCHTWVNVIGFRDAMLWALRDRTVEDPMLGRLAAETAVCLAGWELDEVSRQMQRLNSAKAIFEIPASCGFQNRPSWAQGEVDYFDGVAFKRLGSCGADEITLRIWRAQVTVLFGWLETLRSEFVQKNDGWLGKGDRGDLRTIPLSELEWGDLGHFARRSLPTSDKRRRLAECARMMRNALAHREAVDFETFNRLRQFSV
jgi:hypothetical protein